MSLTNRMRELGTELLDLAEDMEVVPGSVPEWVDLRTVLPWNGEPDNSQWPGGNDWLRSPIKTGITIHHVGAEGAIPEGVAAWTTRSVYNGGKGLPRIQYHFWVGRGGTLYYCLDLGYGQWHDHCGYPNEHISVVLDGLLNETPPTSKQLAKTVQLTRWLMDEYTLSPNMVKGHSELGPTACPGWIQWQDTFFDLLNSVPAYAIYDIQPFKVVDNLEI